MFPIHTSNLTLNPIPFAPHTHRVSQAGASPKSRNSDGRSSTDLAEDKGRRELAQLLRRAALGAHEGVYKVTLLNMAKAALSAGDAEGLGCILEEEPGIVGDCLPDLEGDMCLHYAASLPFVDTTSVLLHHQPLNPNATGSRGRCPLHFAASSGSLTTLRLLLDARADIDAAASDGATALSLACIKGHAHIAEALVASGCRPGILDSAGLSAIHHAARACHLQCISVLSASVNALDSRRDPPL